MKKRNFIFLGIIIFLITWIMALDFLPIGKGYWNQEQIEKINSAESTNNFCFAVMADNKNGLGTFDKILDDINDKRPLFAINVGDLVLDGEKEKYRLFYKTIQKSQVPFLVAIGNHETMEGGRSNYFDIFGNFYYSFSNNNTLFVVLDNANEKNIDSQQMEFLENELKKDFENTFVFVHVPPFDPEDYLLHIPKINRDIELEHSMSDKENAEEFMDLMSRYKVKTVFTSHIHGYFNETRDGVPYIITGGAGGELLLSDPDHYFFHYLDVCIDGSEMNYEIVRFPSPDSNPVDRLGHTIWVYFKYYFVSHLPKIMLAIVVSILIVGQIIKLVSEFDEQ